MTVMICKAVFLWIVSVFTANLEVQIEGPHGWAEKLPTWVAKHSFGGQLYTLLMNGKTLTGYHFYLLGLLLILFHLPLLFTPFSLVLECELLSYFLLFCVVWDFLWFVINPHFGIGALRNKEVWWHQKWLWGLPTDYWSGAVASAVVFCAPFLTEASALGNAAGRWLILLLVNLFGCALAILYARLFIKPIPK
jgi:hypothetical protein